ncbi:claudin-4-like isoform X1 [Acipenser ruthenus]|uniref:claudin-4-like isoform X1 n=2 Tax=Acipenser ruthenus TaxID=7906 RepID=UPI002741610A|nr:claudin-4-like isoform X1 [Acipenser ruthenus]
MAYLPYAVILFFVCPSCAGYCKKEGRVWGKTRKQHQYTLFQDRTSLHNIPTCKNPVTVAAMVFQIVGLSMSMAGLAGTILICALPMWRVTAFIGTNIVVAQVFWEGLWMNCVYESTGKMQCKIYDSLLDLSPDLQAARGLLVITIVLACLGFLIFLMGAQCTNCLENKRVKARIVIISGITFILSGVLTLVPVCWTANTIIHDFYNPLVPEALKRELGAALYVGWATGGFLLFGGAFLCCTCPPREKNYPMRYTPAKSTTHSSYAIKNYV